MSCFNHKLEVLFYLTATISLATNIFFTAFLIIFVSLYALIPFVGSTVIHVLSVTSLLEKKWIWTLSYLVSEILFTLGIAIVNVWIMIDNIDGNSSKTFVASSCHAPLVYTWIFIPIILINILICCPITIKYMAYLRSTHGYQSGPKCTPSAPHQPIHTILRPITQPIPPPITPQPARNRDYLPQHSDTPY